MYLFKYKKHSMLQNLWWTVQTCGDPHKPMRVTIPLPIWVQCSWVGVQVDKKKPWGLPMSYPTGNIDCLVLAQDPLVFGKIYVPKCSQKFIYFIWIPILIFSKMISLATGNTQASHAAQCVISNRWGCQFFTICHLCLLLSGQKGWGLVCSSVVGGA